MDAADAQHDQVEGAEAALQLMFGIGAVRQQLVEALAAEKFVRHGAGGPAKTGSDYTPEVIDSKV